MSFVFCGEEADILDMDIDQHTNTQSTIQSWSALVSLYNVSNSPSIQATNVIECNMFSSCSDILHVRVTTSHTGIYFFKKEI